MRKRKDLLVRLRVAGSDADVIAAFAEMKGRTIPSLKQLEEWYQKSLPSVREEVDARLRALRPYGLKSRELFPKQHSLALDSSAGDAGPLAATPDFSSL